MGCPPRGPRPGLCPVFPTWGISRGVREELGFPPQLFFLSGLCLTSAREDCPDTRIGCPFGRPRGAGTGLASGKKLCEPLTWADFLSSWKLGR